MNLTIINSGPKSALENMQRDAKLLEGLASHGKPILHLYDWQSDAATYGHFVDPWRYFQRGVVEKRKLDLAPRPTGGGIIMHTTDLAFSFLLPASHHSFSESTLENYHFVHEAVKAALEACSFKNLCLISDCEKPKEGLERFCMAKATKYDLVIEGRKVAGAAQRRTRDGYLHQGSIFLSMAGEELRELFIDGARLLEEIRASSYPLLGSSSSNGAIQEARATLKEQLQIALEKKVL